MHIKRTSYCLSHLLRRNYANITIICFCEAESFTLCMLMDIFGEHDNKLSKSDELLWYNWNTICPLCFPRVSQSSQCSIQVSDICRHWRKMQPWIVRKIEKNPAWSVRYTWITLYNFVFKHPDFYRTGPQCRSGKKRETGKCFHLKKWGIVKYDTFKFLKSNYFMFTPPKKQL